jgi:Tfp pilus assembly protein PilN
MSYSFITPKPKPIFSLFSKLWIGFIGFSILLMVVFDLFIVFGINSDKKEIQQLSQNQAQYEQSIETTQEKIAYVRHQKTAAETVYASNMVLKDSMQNLFDLVPDQITLSRIIMEKNRLVLYGKTPSKETFNFLLASPLRSIFHGSNTVFYLNEEGWYRFVSTNTITTSDGFSE